MLGIGSRYGSDMLTVVYAFGGVGSIVGSFVYMRLSAKLGMRAVSAIGAIATAISLAAVLVPEFAVLMYAGVDVRRGSQPHCCVIDAAR